MTHRKNKRFNQSTDVDREARHWYDNLAKEFVCDCGGGFYDYDGTPTFHSDILMYCVKCGKDYIADAGRKKIIPVPR